MNSIKFYLLVLHLILDPLVFDKLQDSFFNPTTVLFVGCFLGIFYTNYMLKNYSWISISLVLICDLLFVLYLINFYYDKTYLPLAQSDIFVVYAIIMFAFMFSKAKDFNQAKYSNAFGIALQLCFNVFGAFRFQNLFKAIHIWTVPTLEKFNLKSISTDLIVDIFVFFNQLYLINAVRMFSSKNNKAKYFFGCLNKIILVFFATIVFYFNYNITLKQYAFDALMTYVPSPYNLYIYNALPQNEDQRFRIIMIFLLNSF